MRRARWTAQGTAVLSTPVLLACPTFPSQSAVQSISCTPRSVTKLFGTNQNKMLLLLEGTAGLPVRSSQRWSVLAAAAVLLLIPSPSLAEVQGEAKKLPMSLFRRRPHWQKNSVEF